MCTVNVLGNVPSGTYAVPGGDTVLVRAGWGDPAQQSCAEFASNATVTITIDGQAVAGTAVPCQLVTPFFGGCSNQWRFDVRYLLPPLGQGTHTVVARFTYKGPVAGASGCAPGPEHITPAGTVQTAQKLVSVT